MMISGQFDRALVAFNQAIGTTADDSMARLLRARTYLAKGDANGAMPDLNFDPRRTSRRCPGADLARQRLVGPARLFQGAEGPQRGHRQAGDDRKPSGARQGLRSAERDPKGHRRFPPRHRAEPRRTFSRPPPRPAPSRRSSSSQEAAVRQRGQRRPVCEGVSLTSRLRGEGTERSRRLRRLQPQPLLHRLAHQELLHLAGDGHREIRRRIRRSAGSCCGRSGPRRRRAPPPAVSVSPARTRIQAQSSSP